MREERSGNPHHSVSVCQVGGRRSNLDGQAALTPKHPGVKVALDDGVNFVAFGLELGIGFAQGCLLRVDKGMRDAVQHVVAQQTQHKGTANALVIFGQVGHRIVQGHERLNHLAGVHVGGQLGASRRDRAPGYKMCPEGVGTLVAQKEGEQLLLAIDDAFRKACRRVFAKEMMRDDGGHDDSRIRMNSEIIITVVAPYRLRRPASERQKGGPAGPPSHVS